eukprot:gene11716-24562_t
MKYVLETKVEATNVSKKLTVYHVENSCFQFKEDTNNWMNDFDLFGSSLLLRYPMDTIHPRHHDLFGLHVVERIHRVDIRHGRHPSNVTVIPGNTILPLCYGRGKNPAHLLFGLSSLFEWTINRPANLPAFDRIAFFKCSEPRNVKHWPWGRAVLDAVLHGLLVAEILKDKDGLYVEPNRTLSTSPLVCFQNLYILSRWGVLFDSFDAAKYFRNVVFPPPIIPVTLTNLEPGLQTDSSGLQQRCQGKRLRISIYERFLNFTRDWSQSQRVMLNRNEVVLLIQDFTSHPVEILTTDWMESLEKQYSVFNSFDVLIASSGSQLANMVLINRTDVGIIEIGLAVRDRYWRTNAHTLHLKSYLNSNVGHIPSDNCTVARTMLRNCTQWSPSSSNEEEEGDVEDETGAVYCPGDAFASWELTGCDFIVNIPTLRHHIAKTISRLCVPST